jgi:predicted RNase H-like HicB family nuclease
MNKSYDVVIEKDCDGFYVATVPEIPGCHTQAKSLDELVQRTKEVIELCMEVATDEAQPNKFVGIQRITVPA